MTTNPLHEIPHVDKSLADGVPEHLRGGLARYVLNGITPGGFLRAAISNNFMRAACMSDDPAHLRPLALFLSNEMPAASIGSAQAMAEWTARGGLNRKVAA